MKKEFQGRILSGEINPIQHELTIHRIKSVPTLSVWNREQMEEILKYLTNETNDAYVITVRDAIPIPIRANEKLQVYEELTSILNELDRPQGE